MKLPSKYVLKRTAVVTLVAVLISVSFSTGIRIVLGVDSDLITIIVRLILPFVIAIPIALVWFSKLENLEQAYRSLVIKANVLAASASTDPLTGVLNRRSFVEQFEGAMQLNIRGWLLIADIDYLKIINDDYGHVIGDEAVIAAAVAMQKALPADSSIGRIGGDEFCAFIPYISDYKIESLIAGIGKIASAEFAERVQLKEASLSISIGYTFCKSKQKFRDMMAQADETLYRKKRARQSN